MASYALQTPPRVAHAKPPRPNDIEERPKVGNNNGQLRIAMPPRVARAKPPGPKICAQFVQGSNRPL